MKRFILWMLLAAAVLPLATCGHKGSLKTPTQAAREQAKKQKEAAKDASSSSSSSSSGGSSSSGN